MRGVRELNGITRSKKKAEGGWSSSERRKKVVIRYQTDFSRAC